MLDDKPDEKGLSKETSLKADEMKDYKFNVPLKKGEHKLSIAFTNDTYKEGEYDSNFYVHAVKFTPHKAEEAKKGDASGNAERKSWEADGVLRLFPFLGVELDFRHFAVFGNGEFKAAIVIVSLLDWAASARLRNWPSRLGNPVFARRNRIGREIAVRMNGNHIEGRAVSVRRRPWQRTSSAAE